MPKVACRPAQAITPTVGLPVVGRYGLAHSLLAWARCELWCRDQGVAMLAPNWNHLRIGPYLRCERDKREYHRLFHFPSYVTGLRRHWLIATRPHVPANGLVPDLHKRQLIVFENKVSRNFEDHFYEVVGRGAELLDALRAMTKECHLPDAAALLEPHIAVHVRLGDFSEPPPDANANGLQGLTNTRLPIYWYAHALSALRDALGRPVPAIVYSDGEDAALAPLLALPAVRRAPLGSAVTDLLSIAMAAALVSSGSGFSIWGSFLGGVPRLCFPGQRLVRVHGDPDAVDLEPELDFHQVVSLGFANAVTARLV